MNGLAALVRPEFVSIGGHPADAESLIRELGALLVASGVARPTLPEAAVERERTYPTGLLLSPDGPNAALPHADREHVITSAAAIAVLPDPVMFHRMDDPVEHVPVRLVTASQSKPPSHHSRVAAASTSGCAVSTISMNSTSSTIAPEARRRSARSRRPAVTGTSIRRPASVTRAP